MPSLSKARVRADHTISILVVDDHGLVRDSLSESLSRMEDFYIVGTAVDADKAIYMVLDKKPDVVLMDIDMPGLSCFDAIQIIHIRAPNTKLVILTAHEHDENLAQALRVQANGFVTKTEGLDALANAIRSVMAGQTHYSPEVMKRLVIVDDGVRLAHPPKTRLDVLSPRERELLRLLAKGLSLKDSAKVLGVSYKTADKQKVSLMSKLGIHDRVGLARYAIREKLVEP